MKLHHRVVLRSPKNDNFAPFMEHGFDVSEDSLVLMIADDDDRLPMLEKLLENESYNRSLAYEYEQADFDATNYFVCSITWLNGYPLPTKTYHKVTFDQSLCPKCRAIRNQVAPYRLNSEPKWGNRQFMGINRVYDALFTRPETWELVFKPFGIKSKEVLASGGKKILESVVQVMIPEVSVDLDIPDNVLRVQCEECGTVKYDPIRGIYPAITDNVSEAAFRPRTLFGSGWSSNNLIVFQRELYEVLRDQDHEGITFAPMGVDL